MVSNDIIMNIYVIIMSPTEYVLILNNHTLLFDDFASKFNATFEFWISVSYYLMFSVTICSIFMFRLLVILDYVTVYYVVLQERSYNLMEQKWHIFQKILIFLITDQYLSTILYHNLLPRWTIFLLGIC